MAVLKMRLASAAVSGDAKSRRAETLAAFGLGAEDLAAWRESGLPEGAFDEWLTDRFARRAILDALALGPEDRLLELGCGGGLLLRDALATGSAATGLDHSEEMVE